MFWKKRSKRKPAPEYVGLVRLPAWVIVVTVPALSALAFGARDVSWLIALTVVDAVFILLVMGSLAPVARENRFFIIQTTVITGLYCLQNGGVSGIVPGLRVSWQLLLAFTPGILMMKAVPNHKLIALLERFIPYRLAFVISTSLRFIPLLIGEAQVIYEAQVLRGARILPRDLLNPVHWIEAVRCLVVPIIVQSMKITGEVSQSAIARGFGMKRERTHWTGAATPAIHMESRNE